MGQTLKHMPGESKKMFPRLAGCGCEIKSMRPIFKTEMLICESKATSDVKFCLHRSHIFKSQQFENAYSGFVLESRIARSILVHCLCSIEIYVIRFRNRI